MTDGQSNCTFSATGETRQIPDHIYCNSTNLVNMIHCRRCKKQCKGQTKRRLKDRFKEHRPPLNIPTPSSKPATISDHFLPNHYAPNDTGLIPLKLKHTSRDAIRKAREAYPIDRGQTLDSKGINTEPAELSFLYHNVFL